jgi:hypothetical protein
MRYIWLLILAAACSANTFAAVVEIDFTGTVYLSGFSSVNVGDSFTGSAYYSSPDTPYVTESTFCGSPGACVVNLFHMPVSFFLSVDGSTVSTTNLSPAYIQVQDSVTAGPNDRVDMNSGDIPLVLTGPIAAQRSSAFDLVLISFAGPTSLFSSPQIPLVFPSVSQWSTEAAIDFATFGPSGDVDRQFAGNITSLVSTTTPEPSTFFLASLILPGFGAWARGSIFLWCRKKRKSRALTGQRARACGRASE